ncbi:MAG: hypothetical protein II242_05660 [Peptococcaceae bacterium]|nr:hypothetical protein [Peptococcaceae bacterium]
MALLTTFEGTETQAAPLTISDLFNVNDYFGVKLFGDAWNDVKRAAAIIAQRAVNDPIMFYISSLSNNQAAPGKSSEAGRKLWGYNDAAGVELLGAPCWGAVKSEFDELLGWNPFTAAKKVINTIRTPVDWAANKIESWEIPFVSDIATAYKWAVDIGDEFSPITQFEKTYNLVVEDKGYVTQAKIDAEKEKKKQQELKQMYVDQTSRASKAASEAAKAQKAYEERAAELERTMKQYGAAMEPVAQQMATAEQAKSDRLNTALWVCGGLGVFYLLTRNKK